MTAAPPPLAPDLNQGLRRLKLATMRRLAPELLLTARTQRWAAEELLRTLVEAEISARDASNARTRMKAAAFPVTKTLEEFDLGVSSVPTATFTYLASLEWIRARENLCLVGPAGTGKSHLLVALGANAVAAGHKVRYLTAAELTETLYRGLADNSVGRVIDTLLRNELILINEVGFAPLDDTGAQLLFRVVAAAYERRALGIASHWPFESWGRFLPEHTTAVSLLDPAAAPRECRGHGRRFLPHARSPGQRRNHPEQDLINPRGGDFSLATTGTATTWPSTSAQSTSSPWKTSSSATCAPPQAPSSRFPGEHRPGPATDRQAGGHTMTVPLDAADAIELAELLEFLSDWLESDRANLTASLARFVGSQDYGPGALRDDFARFRFPPRRHRRRGRLHPRPAVTARPAPVSLRNPVPTASRPAGATASARPAPPPWPAARQARPSPARPAPSPARSSAAGKPGPRQDQVPWIQTCR